jgi:hypothetical protein
MTPAPSLGTLLLFYKNIIETKENFSGMKGMSG